MRFLAGHSRHLASSSHLLRLRRHQPVFLAGIVIVAVLAVSCSSTPPPAPPEGRASPLDASPPAEAAPEPEATAEAPPDGPRVPKELRFEAPGLSGGTIRGADFVGQDLVIWFWAPW